MVLKEAAHLDIKTSSCLKGILACMVLICHMHARVSLFSSNILGPIFTAFGYLSVSVFFFLSGYGLKEAASKKEHYVSNFPKKKLLPFFCICCFTILIYFIRDICVGDDVNILTLMQSFFFGNTIVDNGWYLQTQLLFYIIFYLAYNFVKNKKSFALLFIIVLYCIFCAIAKLSTTWYEASLCFPLGILYSEYKDKINFILFKNKIIHLISILCVLIVFIITLFFGNKPFLNECFRIPLKLISSVFFCLLVLTIISLINIRNPITEFLGKLSLEIYLLQGIFLNLFKKQLIIDNDWVYIICVAVCTLLLAFLFHPIYKSIGNIGNSHLNGSNHRNKI